MFALEEIELMPMPVGWFDNRPVLDALASKVDSFEHALSLVERMGPSRNLNAVGCTISIIYERWVHDRERALELMLRFFAVCRFVHHSLFMNTFLPAMAYLTDGVTLSPSQQASLGNVCAAALQSVEEQCAYGRRADENLRLVALLLEHRIPPLMASTVQAEYDRVAALHQMRWG